MLAKQRLKLGEDHPDTLLTLYELAKAHASAHQSDVAKVEASEFIGRAKKIEHRLPQDVALPPFVKRTSCSMPAKSNGHAPR